MDTHDQLETAKRLVDILERLNAAQEAAAAWSAERDDLLARMAGAAPAKPKAKAKPEIKPTQPEPEPTPEPEAPTKPMTPDEAMALYDTNVPKATDSQKKMIFGMLSRDHGIVADVDMKAVIVGIVAELHNGVVIESIARDLSKVWAGDVITYLQKAKSEDLKKFTDKVEPF